VHGLTAPNVAPAAILTVAGISVAEASAAPTDGTKKLDNHKNSDCGGSIKSFHSLDVVLVFDVGVPMFAVRRRGQKGLVRFRRDTMHMVFVPVLKSDMHDAVLRVILRAVHMPAAFEFGEPVESVCAHTFLS
jgi:hypothetical protein